MWKIVSADLRRYTADYSVKYNIEFDSWTNKTQGRSLGSKQLVEFRRQNLWQDATDLTTYGVNIRPCSVWTKTIWNMKVVHYTKLAEPRINSFKQRKGFCEGIGSFKWMLLLMKVREYAKVINSNSESLCSY